MAIIGIGVHSGTAYYDCTKTFIQASNDLLDVYTNGKISVEAPFMDWNKLEIWEFCHQNEVPVKLTYSCEAGNQEPCGKCLSCLDRRALDARTT